MRSGELLCRIKAGDDEAFRTMVLTYGKPVYMRLLERSGNKEVAKAALREALIDLYITVKMANSRDPVEAVLYKRAEEIQADMLRRSCERLFYAAAKEAAPKPLAAQPEIRREEPLQTDIPVQATPAKRHWGAGKTAAAIALSAGILAALWVIAGLLMDMGFLPYIDMGYGWFNMNIAPWF